MAFKVIFGWLIFIWRLNFCKFLTIVKLFENKCLILFHFRQTLSIYETWIYNKPTTYIKCRWPGFFLTRQDAKIQVYQLQTNLVRSLTFNGLFWTTKAATYSCRKKKSHHHTMNKMKGVLDYLDDKKVPWYSKSWKSKSISYFRWN